jgi:beta-lactamase class A
VGAGNRLNWLAVFSAVCLVSAVLLAVLQLVLYSRSFNTLPGGLSLGRVPVGGLTEQQAIEQLVLVYHSPVELYYRDSLINLDPALVNFQTDTAHMLPEGNQVRTTEGFWGGYWEFLWVRLGEVHDVPLRSTYSQERLRSFLEDIAARYDQPGSPPQADPDRLGFIPGEPGHALDVDAAMSLIDAALRSPIQRSIILPLVEQTAIQPSYDTLADLIKTNLDMFQFDGTFSLYLSDLSSGRELVINLSGREPVQGPIAYSGLSAIKIPVMVSFFARNEGPLTDEQSLLLQRSIDESQNTATDLLLRTIGRGDGFEGTRRMTADMRHLGLHNTYLSGLLDVAGAVLSPLATPANSRADINTRPDPYNQTTADDMGALMVMIYQCSMGGGALMVAFPGEFTADECRLMIDLLTANLVGPILITGGSSPDGVVAHKHGWDFLPLRFLADVSLVFTPGGSYSLTIFLHHEETMGFDDGNRLIISLARAVYNFYNPPD